MNSARDVSKEGISQPIKLNEIAAYCSLYRIEKLEDVDDVVFYVQYIDALYMEETEKKRKQAEAKARQNQMSTKK